MSEHDERVEALLYDHREDALTCYDHGGYCCVCGSHDQIGFRSHLADVLRDLLAAERAKALREAAAEHRNQFGPVGGWCRSWLRREADRIHPADPEETR